MPYKNWLANGVYIAALWVAAIGLLTETPVLYQVACWLLVGAAAINLFRK